MENLSLILWREREVLESLHYCLEQEQLVLTNGRTRWLARAARAVEDVLTELRETELMRAVAADAAAAERGLPPNPSLEQLAEASDEPWRSILLDHREALLASTREVAELAALNRELLAAGHAATRAALAAWGEPVAGAPPYDRGHGGAPGPRRLLVEPGT